MLQLPDTNLLLDAMLLGVTDEVYIIDASSKQLIYVSESALKHTGYNLESLKEYDLDSILGLSPHVLQRHLDRHRNHAYFVELQQNQMPIIGNIRHNNLRLMVLASGKQEFILIIKNDIED